MGLEYMTFTHHLNLRSVKAQPLPLPNTIHIHTNTTLATLTPPTTSLNNPCYHLPQRYSIPGTTYLPLLCYTVSATTHLVRVQAKLTESFHGLFKVDHDQVWSLHLRLCHPLHHLKCMTCWNCKPLLFIGKQCTVHITLLQHTNGPILYWSLCTPQSNQVDALLHGFVAVTS